MAVPDMHKSALTDRNFLLYWSCSIITTHGVWIYRVTLGWQAWEISRSSFWVGAVAFSLFFPSIIFAPLSGVLADRYDLRIAAVSAQASIMLLAAILAILMGFDIINIYGLCLFAFLHGIATGVFTPVRLALLPCILSRDYLPGAIGLTALSFNISRFIGPALAGLAIRFYGPAWAIGFYVLSIIPALIALLVIDIRPRQAPVQKHTRILEELRNGFTYAITHSEIRILFGMVAIVAVMVRGLLELLPVITELVFNRGSGAFAALTSATGAGAIFAALFLARSRSNRALLVMSISGCTTASILLVLLSSTTQFNTGLVIAAMLGCMATMSSVSVQTLLQLRVPDEYRGRIMGIWSVFAMGGSAIGGLLLGSLAHLTGLHATMLANSMLSVIFSVFAGISLYKYSRPAVR
jgi:MFS family permease